MYRKGFDVKVIEVHQTYKVTKIFLWTHEKRDKRCRQDTMMLLDLAASSRRFRRPRMSSRSSGGLSSSRNCCSQLVVFFVLLEILLVGSKHASFVYCPFRLFSCPATCNLGYCNFQSN